MFVLSEVYSFVLRVVGLLKNFEPMVQFLVKGYERRRR